MVLVPYTIPPRVSCPALAPRYPIVTAVSARMSANVHSTPRHTFHIFAPKLVRNAKPSTPNNPLITPEPEIDAMPDKYTADNQGTAAQGYDQDYDLRMQHLSFEDHGVASIGQPEQVEYRRIQQNGDGQSYQEVDHGRSAVCRKRLVCKGRKPEPRTVRVKAYSRPKPTKKRCK